MSRLTAAQRKRIEPKDFAGPDRSYPIEDKNHAKNALSRVSQFGSSELKAQVRAKVHKKYPNLGEGEKAKERADKPKRACGGEVKWRADGGSVEDQMDQQPDPVEVKRWGSVQNAKAAADAQAYAKQRDRSNDFTGNNDWAEMGKTIQRKRGGRLKLDAGAGSGIGRLEQAQALKKKERVG